MQAKNTTSSITYQQQAAALVGWCMGTATQEDGSQRSRLAAVAAGGIVCWQRASGPGAHQLSNGMNLAVGH